MRSDARFVLIYCCVCRWALKQAQFQEIRCFRRVLRAIGADIGCSGAWCNRAACQCAMCRMWCLKWLSNCLLDMETITLNVQRG